MRTRKVRNVKFRRIVRCYGSDIWSRRWALIPAKTAHGKAGVQAICEAHRHIQAHQQGSRHHFTFSSLSLASLLCELIHTLKFSPFSLVAILSLLFSCLILTCNQVYYEAKAKRLREQADVTRGGVNNEGYDDVNYDYILSGDGEVFADRYILKHRIGKGSFGQVVCAYDKEAGCEVAIKIIKSRRPFLVQAQTEIALLTLVLEKDNMDEHNLVRLQHKFVYRNHQCLVFEMLSYNLYELLKNTR